MANSFENSLPGIGAWTEPVGPAAGDASGTPLEVPATSALSWGRGLRPGLAPQPQAVIPIPLHGNDANGALRMVTARGNDANGVA
jgi:hypothetical protein